MRLPRAHPHRDSRPALPGNWHNLVVLYPETHVTDKRGSAHHLAAHLAARDVAVLYVNPYLPPRHHFGTDTASHPQRTQRRWLHLYRRHWAVLDLPGTAGVPVVSQTRTAQVIRAAVASLSGSVKAILHTGRTPTVLGLVPAQLRVFWAEEDYCAAIASTGAEPGRYGHTERRLASHADVVLAASAALAHRWALHGFATTVIPPGCHIASDEEVPDTISKPPTQMKVPAPIACVLGPFGPQYDLALLTAIADAGHSVLMVGAIHGGANPAPWHALADHACVQWLQPEPDADLSAIIRCAQVGLLPIVDSTASRARFYAAALDFLASGVGAVATPTPSVEWLACPHLTTAVRADYVGAVATALQAPADPTVRAARQDFASHHTWSARVDALMDLIAPRGDHG